VQHRALRLHGQREADNFGARLLLNRTQAIFGATGALVLVGAVVFKPVARADAPRLPSDSDEVIERLPPHDPAERTRREVRRALASRPDDLQAAVWLARLDIEASRSRADPRYLGQAQSALAPWWDSPSPPEPVLVLRATIRQSLHDFDSALADLDRAVAKAPDDTQAWITRSVVLSVRGRYVEAKTSCEPVQRLAPSIVFTICDASVDALTGHASAAYDRIQQSLQAVTTPEMREWALSTLAEIAERLGRDDDSALLFQQALALDAEDAYARAAYADLLLDEGRAKEAAHLLAGRTENDNLLLRLVLAERALGDPNVGAHADLLAARYDASRLRGDTVHRREEARFVLGVKHDARAALDLARANWDVQREPWDVRVLLAAALEARDPATAALPLAFVDDNHLEDSHIRALAQSLRAMR
jgi:tetratricopeptide (TPR) repeat protein